MHRPDKITLNMGDYQALLPRNFKIPTLERYERKGDPLNHLDAYQAWMELDEVEEAIICHTFPFTLGGIARTWFTQLMPKSIRSFA